MKKRILLVAGGGTLGTYTAQELLRLGHYVDVICGEEKKSDHERLTYYRFFITAETLEQHLRAHTYDGIVNFLHYPEVENYVPFHELLMAHTSHLIVLSSYRVYADEQHPVTEEAPKLLDVSRDEEFLQTEKYALSKAKLERYLNEQHKGEKWTIVRPVISFSAARLDLVTYSGREIPDMAKAGKKISLPVEARDLAAGLDWAGNSGKLIANLLFREEAFGQAYTVSSAQNLTWGQLADLFAELCGAKFVWLPMEEYLEVAGREKYHILIYDRLFDRTIDNRKILQVTGLCPGDFVPVKDGLKLELDRLF